MSSLLPPPLRAGEIAVGKPPIVMVDDCGPAVEWARRHRDGLRAAATAHGCVVVRGLGLGDAVEVGSVFAGLGGPLMADRESFAARRVFAEGVYSSSRWISTQPMGMHHELSYAFRFPMLMLFACLRAPVWGGATVVADSAAVCDGLPAWLVDRFARRGWVLMRNYTDEIGGSVADSFGTDDRCFVEAYCKANAIEFSWPPGGGLRTWQRRSAVVAHPVSGLRCWFNQVGFLNEWALDAEVREFLLDTYGREGLPFNTFYGNGEPIGREVVELINRTYETNTRREPWQTGDLMLVDNIRTAHSREPFGGEREVLIAMADPLTATALREPRTP